MVFSPMRRAGFLCAVVFVSTTAAQAQLRVVNWNVTNYSAGREDAFRTGIYGVNGANGLTMRPDLFLGQEFISQAGVNNYRDAILNHLPSGSPGDWAACDFVNGPDTDSICFYRTSKLDYIGFVTVSVGGASPNQPRNIMRYDFRLKGYTAASCVISCYPSHMKAQESGGDDDLRRLTEAQRIRDNAETLPAGWNFLYGGDTNIQTSSGADYQEMVGSQVNNAGRLFDPIKTPGSWNNNVIFQFVHTQDPAGSGGMDDRHDQILLCSALVDGNGFDYIGNPSVAYSTSTWNDSNHSYRAWGNDGTSYNLSLNNTSNSMVGNTIATALRTSASSGGHLPVLLDLRVPAKVDSETLLDFGQVAQFGSATLNLNVSNSGNVALWTATGIDDLDYTLLASAGFSAPGGSFSDLAGGGGDVHVITMDTSTPGIKSGTLTITSDAPDQPSRVVTLMGEVLAVPTCAAADANCDLTVNGSDAPAFVDLLLGTAVPCDVCVGDMNTNGMIDGDDIAPFIDEVIP